MSALKRDIHVQRDSFRAMCGRRLGTPRGRIYPGVHAELPAWFEDHKYPEAMRPRVCRACLATSTDAVKSACGEPRQTGSSREVTARKDGSSSGPGLKRSREVAPQDAAIVNSGPDHSASTRFDEWSDALQADRGSL